VIQFSGYQGNDRLVFVGLFLEDNHPHTTLLVIW